MIVECAEKFPFSASGFPLAVTEIFFLAQTMANDLKREENCEKIEK